MVAKDGKRKADNGTWRQKGAPRGKPFAKGFDARRHILTTENRRKGFLMATRVAKMSSRVRVWLRWKIKHHYRSPMTVDQAVAGDIEF
jgi:hypothetical protein